MKCSPAFVAHVHALVGPGRMATVERLEGDDAAALYREARSRARFFGFTAMSMFDVCRYRPDRPNLPSDRGSPPMELIASGYVRSKRDRRHDR